MTFHERKKDRTEFYNRFIKGWRLKECTACNGSGLYDNTGSPFCGNCGGSGKERYKNEVKS